MNQKLTELVFILDKSGSMSGLEKDTMGGFNALIEKQKKEEGEAVVTTILFNDRTHVIHNRTDIKEVTPLTEKEYFVGGCTALLDAIGEAITNVNERRAEMKEDDIPSKTMFIITTDGLENSSREYTYKAVKSLISMCEEKGFEFIFLGANIDAAAEADKFGIRRERAVNYHCDAKGVATNFMALDEAVSSLRQRGAVSECWRESIDEDYESRDE